MIRQVITCNVCGSPKRQTNHLFIAYEECGELRISAWNSPHLLCPNTKHLCGEACLHKLIEAFLIRLLELGTQHVTDKSKTAPDVEPGTIGLAACAEHSSSMRQLQPRTPEGLSGQ